MPRLAYGRLYAHECIAKSRAVRARQKEIVRAGLDCKVDPALFGETDMRQRKPRAFVGDMDFAAGPFGKNRRAADGLDCRHVHMLGEVRGGVSSPFTLETLTAPRQNRRAFGVNGAPDAKSSERFECLQNRPVRRTRDRRVFAAPIQFE